MARLEELTRGASVRGILPNQNVIVVDVASHGSKVIELTYKDASGRLSNELLYRDCGTVARRENIKLKTIELRRRPYHASAASSSPQMDQIPS